MAKPSRASVSDAIRAAFSSAVTRLDANEPALWTKHDPEAVHQARVATRRLRSDLRTLDRFVWADWAAQVRGELRWLGAELGGVRDVQVLHERLDAHAARLPDADAEAARAAIRRLDTDHSAARAELLHALRSPRYALLHHTLADAVTHPRLTHYAEQRASEALPDAIRPMWRKLRRAVEKLGPTPPDAALHAVRIRAKRCRYGCELATPYVGRPARDLATAVEEVQNVLGAHQDAVVAREWLTKAAHECGPGEAYALGMLAEIERETAAQARAEFPAAWRAAQRPKLRSWL